MCPEIPHRTFVLALAAWTGLGLLPSRADTLLVPVQYPTIQAAMNAAQAGDTVLVADGTYTGPGNKGLYFPNPNQPFTLRSVNGPESCIIDCEGTGSAFFLVANEPPEAVVQGFTIKNGNSSTGGAAFLHHDCDATFIDCIFTENTASAGGAIFTENDSSATFIGCTFRGNKADAGGALYISDSSDPRFIHCTIENNEANAEGGGVYANTFGTTPRLVNCTITGNAAGGDGGGVFVGLGSPEVAHCTVAGNSSGGSGGGLAARGSASVTLTHTILWDDTAAAGSELALLDHPVLGGAAVTVSYCDVEGGPGAATVGPGSTLSFGAGNVAADPQFIDLTAGDVRTAGSSPVIDAGDPAAALDPSQPYDILGFGHPRLDDGDFDGVEVVDIGAVEFGGLLGNLSATVGSPIELTLWGLPAASYLLFLGFPTVDQDLGGLGTLFLDATQLVLVSSGALPPAGQTLAASVPAPAGAAGVTVSLQAVAFGPLPSQAPHLTNLEEVTIQLP